MGRHNIPLVKTLFWFVGFSLLLGLSRIIPHPPNFTPLLSVAVFLPQIVKRTEYTVALTLLAMFIGDLYWGLHPFMIWTYTSIVLCSLLASKYKNLFLNSIWASCIFFIVTNFGVWAGGYYGYTFLGLVTCYIAAIPFFTNTLIGTLFYSLIFYLVHKVITKYDNKMLRQKSLSKI